MVAQTVTIGTGEPVHPTTANGRTQPPPETPSQPKTEPNTDPDSWTPTDPGPYLRGEVKRATPSIGLYRSDGLQILYPGKEHAVFGEMEAGKTWFLLACAVAEMHRGQHVVWIDFEEPDQADQIDRLLILGATPSQILKLWHWVGPYQPVTAARLLPLLQLYPSLTVLDGVNEAMSLHGWKIMDPEGAAAYRGHLVKPFMRWGAAVVSSDHVVKDQNNRGRSQLGSIHKGNGITGSLIMLENAEPFGRDRRGRSHVFITKDRPGHLRKHGRATKTCGKTFIGELVVDAEHSTLGREVELKLWAPREDSSPATAVDEDKADEGRVLAAVAALAMTGKEPNLRNIRTQAGVRKQRTDDALTRLVLADRLVEEAGLRGARLFTVPGDHLSEGS